MKRILLFDVSHLFFRAFFAIPRTLTDASGGHINAIFGVASMLLSLLESECPTYIFGAKDEKGKTHRHDVMPEYKGQRPDMPSDLLEQLPKIYEVFGSYHIPLFSEAGYEGDDFLATLAEKYRGQKEYEVLIVTGDHDAFQLVGDNIFVLLPQNGGKKGLLLDRNGIFEKMGVFPEQIPDYKALVGDSSDNLCGIAGIGPKTAVKLLTEYKTLENLLAHLDEIPGAQQDKIRAGKEIAITTKEMTTLHRNLELKDFDLEAGNVGNIVEKDLDTFFRHYNFHSLLNRLPKAFKALYGKLDAKDAEEEEIWAEVEAAKNKNLSAPKAEKKEQTVEDQMSLF